MVMVAAGLASLRFTDGCASCELAPSWLLETVDRVSSLMVSSL